MLYKEILRLFDLLDRPDASAREVLDMFSPYQVDCSFDVVKGEKGTTEFVTITIPGCNGRLRGGSNPTLGIIGRLGGIGARPNAIGFVSDGDGALAALAAALKLSCMKWYGDCLEGDVIVTTHIDPDAPVRPHDPVPFMGSAVSSGDVNRLEIKEGMDAVLSIDTTKGNEIVNHRGIAITPTIKDGTILPVSNDLLKICSIVSGEPAFVLPVSQYDLTPYGNGLHHINSILQPSVATSSPMIGVAITTASVVAGCATGASHIEDIEIAARFAVEVAKSFTSKKCTFYDEREYADYLKLYGNMNKRFQSMC